MKAPYTEMQLDALRELANIASGTAATALSQMLGREIGLSVPRALALSLADAVDAAGDPAETINCVALALDGDIEGVVMLLMPIEAGTALLQLLGLEPDSEYGESALCEIGNILGSSYLTALASMTGLALEPHPPNLVVDMLGAVVATVLAQTAGHGDVALVLDSELEVAGDTCSISFLLLPDSDGAFALLAPLGLAEPTN
ncbi:MAG: chemotaxis protein CheC [Solirubrobacteraceae bacterium]